MRKEISFYSKAFGKQLSGSYTVERGILTVYCADGRKKKAQARTVGVRGPEYLVRRILVDLQRAKAD